MAGRADIDLRYLNRHESAYTAEQQVFLVTYRKKIQEKDQLDHAGALALMANWPIAKIDQLLQQQRKLTGLQQQTEEVKQIMLDVIEEIINRGEKLTPILDKTIELEKGAISFNRNARSLKEQQSCCLGGCGIFRAIKEKFADWRNEKRWQSQKEDGTHLLAHQEEIKGKYGLA
ncbi:MAG: Synaptobrevin [Gammaproteobacteria bacterium]|jgi:hypothetical protein|nr:Synaptobrevin [Gammaproteobacteria bacterium]